MAGEAEMTNFANDTDRLIQHNEEHSWEQQIPPISSGHHVTRKRNRAREVRMIILACMIFATAITTALIIDIYTGSHHTGHAAVVSDVKECADVGLDLIKKGGSAVDAAIGSMLCVGVMNPESSGLGGGGFMLIVVPEQNREVATVVDFREVAPMAASKNMFHGNKSLASWGGLAVAVPGEIRGYEAAHKKYGKLKWSDVIKPAIKIAKEGFRVTEHTERSLTTLKIEDVASTQLGKLVAPQGVFLKQGDKMSNPALADTLQQIAVKGADALYSGPIADSIEDAVNRQDVALCGMVDHLGFKCSASSRGMSVKLTPAPSVHMNPRWLPIPVKSANGILTKEDLKEYKPILKDAINASFLGYQVITTPLPSGGPVLVSMLNILEGFNFTREDQDKSLTYHYIVEAIKFAFAERSLLEDSKNATNITKRILSKGYAKLLRSKISANRTYGESHYGLDVDQSLPHGTAHVSVIGPDGDIVSLTSTINGYFGSGIMTHSGIILNNQMADFSIPGVQNVQGAGPPTANFVVPGRRPLSSVVPTAVLHEEKRCWHRMSVGCSGGLQIPSAVAQVLINKLAFEDSLSQSIERARVYYGVDTGLTEIEGNRFKDSKLKASLVQSLREKGHNVTDNKASVTDVNGVSYFQEKISAHADSRRGGAQGSAQF